MIRYPLVNEEAALLWMANMGCIDLNAWCSRADRPDRPDFALFDLDPTPEAGFAAAAEVALLVRDALAAVDLRGYPEDERRRRRARARAARAPLRLRPDARGGARDLARARLDAARPRHHGVVEGQAPGRPDRREPERPRPHDRLRLLGAPDAGRAGVGAGHLGRARRRRRAAATSRWRSCSTGSPATATCTRRCSRTARRSARPCARSEATGGDSPENRGQSPQPGVSVFSPQRANRCSPMRQVQGRGGLRSCARLQAWW